MRKGGLEMKLETAIKKAKNNLIKRAIKNGMTENFGAKEVMEIQDKFNYSDLIYGSGAERNQAKKIDDFDNWCMNYDGN